MQDWVFRLGSRCHLNQSKVSISVSLNSNQRDILYKYKDIFIHFSPIFSFSSQIGTEQLVNFSTVGKSCCNSASKRHRAWFQIRRTRAVGIQWGDLYIYYIHVYKCRLRLAWHHRILVSHIGTFFYRYLENAVFRLRSSASSIYRCHQLPSSIQF